MIEPKSNQLEQKGNAFLIYVIKVQEEKNQNTITSPYTYHSLFSKRAQFSQSNFKYGEPEIASRCATTSRLEFHFEKA